MIKRAITNSVKAGDVVIGGGAPISIQSMLNKPSDDAEGNVSQALELQAAGCEIIRVSVPDKKAIRTVEALKSVLSVPLVADIHFDYKLALLSAAAGVDKIRINPGNIGGEENVRAVAKACRERGIPIRIGVNSGSVEKEILAKYKSPTAEALVESACYHASLLEKNDFTDIVISIKSSDVPTMIEAYRIASQRLRYPLHLGVTEAGTERMGLVKSAIGIGSLLADGIGDTIRVSLTDSPVLEVKAAKDILSALSIRQEGVQFISCPTCGRTKIDLIGLAKEAEAALSSVEKPIKVAIMGCVVNGPGEAKEADIGIAGGDGCAVIFKKGEVLRKVAQEDILSELLREIEMM